MVRSIPPVTLRPNAALVRRRSLIGFRGASEQMWGQAGLHTIAEALSPEVRERTAGLRPLPEWIPVNDLIAWHVAVWEELAKRDESVMTRHARLTVDQGFGRVKRFVVSMLSPEALAERVVALWSDEYSTGRLTTLSVEPGRVRLSLADHPFVEIPLMRYIISEVYRYVLSMTRAENVTVSHAVRDAALIVNLSWE